MKAFLLSLSVVATFIGTSFTARGDDERAYYHHHRYHEDRNIDRFDHDWNDGYWHHHHYGYWHSQRGYWTVRHHHHLFVTAPGVSVEVH
jgi:hypothetical protein